MDHHDNHPRLMVDIDPVQSAGRSETWGPLPGPLFSRNMLAFDPSWGVVGSGDHWGVTSGSLGDLTPQFQPRTLSAKQALGTNFPVFGTTRPWIEPQTCQSQGGRSTTRPLSVFEVHLTRRPR